MMTIERTIVYHCEYMLRDLRNYHIFYSTSSQRGIADFKDGFWVNENMQFTTTDDCLYWIPPSAITRITKETHLK